jgi:hypothetical protein
MLRSRCPAGEQWRIAPTSETRLGAPPVDRDDIYARAALVVAELDDVPAGSIE